MRSRRLDHGDAASRGIPSVETLLSFPAVSGVRTGLALVTDVVGCGTSGLSLDLCWLSRLDPTWWRLESGCSPVFGRGLRTR
jgi:hypothetical protein